ncbi:hypothetical protein M404DRAFT_992124 [Pisolithus tinctorius Marx 270]|uniref:Uncharacterized protein n=1 Tax=Pisolithus tinctorius Marx 270 TaxID=870435 RepID=A0A0C3KWK6_PISTI|nr:hypothetical protein M404DRAFT_992124 [Pisolithus tinctorius Marx 270]
MDEPLIECLMSSRALFSSINRTTIVIVALTYDFLPTQTSEARGLGTIYDTIPNGRCSLGVKVDNSKVIPLWMKHLR